MLLGYKQFKQLSDSKNVEFINKRFNDSINNFIFLQIENKIDINHEIISNINQSLIIVIQTYSDAYSKYFIFCFDNYLFIINCEDYESLETFFSSINKEKTKIYFLSNLQKDFQEINQLKNSDLQNFAEISNTFIDEIESFVSNFQLINQYDSSIHKFWKIINKCIAGYLIKKSYMKCNYDRYDYVITNYFKEEKETIFNENDFIYLRPIGTSTLIVLKYHIEKKLLCAVKSYKYDTDNELANREINNYKQLKHPFVPRYYGYYIRDFQKNIVIEFIDGTTLNNINKFSFSFEQKIHMIYDIFFIFQYLHYNEFIYRDLKPFNVMITNNQIILIDFDRMIKNNSNVLSGDSFTNDLIGIWIAPEIAELGEIPSFKSDIYSIGIMIYYILMEKYPIIGSNKNKNIDLKQKYPKIYDVFLKCINEKVEKRPTLNDLCNNFLSALRDEIEVLFNLIDINRQVFILLSSNKLYELGNLYLNGNSLISRDINKSIYYYSLAAKQNDINALFQLGHIYFKGKYIAKDINKAIYYFTLASNNNCIICQKMLGKIYYYYTKEINKAIYFLSLAANNNDPESQFLLGLIYYEGEYVSTDMKKAFHYFTLSANQNYAEAQNYLGNMHFEADYLNKNMNKALYYYSLAANQKQPGALFNLGFFYYEGKYVKRDIDKALYYLEVAGKEGNEDAQCLLGLIYYDDTNIRYDLNKAIYYFSLEANNNNSGALFCLGKIYLDKKYGKFDINQSIHYLTLAANLNHKNAQFCLGMIYFNGMFIASQINKAIYYFMLAANQNHPEAQFHLGFIYFENIYVERNIRISLHYYELAALNNHPKAQTNLGSLYLSGEYVKQDINKAIFYFSLASKQNIVNAHVFLGSIYYSNKFVPRDIKKAIHFFTLGANQNNPFAQNELGNIFCNGLYVKIDIDKAIHYYKLAANQKYIYSLNNLASIYYNGWHVERDLKKAIKYLLMIEDQNNPAVLNNLGHLYISSNDIHKGIECLKLAAQKNFLTSQKVLGLLYYFGNVIPQDINKAIYYLTLAAKQNEPLSQFYLGKIYYDGIFVQKNIKNALFYFERSALKENSGAQFYLANIYLEGKYVDRDIKKAINFYKELSSLNDSQAKNNLGVIYKNGLNDIEVNINYAKQYFEEAIKLENDPLSMYNLANILLDENLPESNKKSIKLLIDSAIQEDFLPSINLLLLYLIKNNFSINLDNIQKLLEENKVNSKNVQSEFYYILKSIQNNLFYFDSNENAFQYYRKTDFLYINNDIISWENIKNIEKLIRFKPFDINNDFYEGFGFDL